MERVVVVGPVRLIAQMNFRSLDELEAGFADRVRPDAVFLAAAQLSPRTARDAEDVGIDDLVVGATVQVEIRLSDNATALAFEGVVGWRYPAENVPAGREAGAGILVRRALDGAAAVLARMGQRPSAGARALPPGSRLKPQTGESARLRPALVPRGKGALTARPPASDAYVFAAPSELSATGTHEVDAAHGFLPGDDASTLGPMPVTGVGKPRTISLDEPGADGATALFGEVASSDSTAERHGPMPHTDGAFEDKPTRVDLSIEHAVAPVAIVGEAAWSKRAVITATPVDTRPAVGHAPARPSTDPAAFGAAPNTNPGGDGGAPLSVDLPSADAELVVEGFGDPLTTPSLERVLLAAPAVVSSRAHETDPPLVAPAATVAIFPGSGTSSDEDARTSVMRAHPGMTPDAADESSEQRTAVAGAPALLGESLSGFELSTSEAEIPPRPLPSPDAWPTDPPRVPTIEGTAYTVSFRRPADPVVAVERFSWPTGTKRIGTYNSLQSELEEPKSSPDLAPASTFEAVAAMFEVEPFSGEDGAFFRGETDPELNVSAVVNRAVALAGTDGDDLALAVADSAAPVRPAMRPPASLVAQPFASAPGTSEGHRITAQDLAAVARTPPPDPDAAAPPRPAAPSARLSHLPGAGTPPPKPER